MTREARAKLTIGVAMTAFGAARIVAVNSLEVGKLGVLLIFAAGLFLVASHDVEQP